MRYKIGDIVTIHKCIHGHMFDIGEKVKIIKYSIGDLDYDVEALRYKVNHNMYNSNPRYFVTEEEIKIPLKVLFKKL